MSISANVNDQLSISYEQEKSEPTLKTSSTTVYDLTSTGVQASYTMGGVSISVAMNEMENAAGSTGTTFDTEGYDLNVAFSF